MELCRAERRWTVQQSLTCSFGDLSSDAEGKKSQM